MSMIPGRRAADANSGVDSLPCSHINIRISSCFDLTMALGIAKTLRFLVLSAVLLGGVVVRTYPTRILTETFTDTNHRSRMR